MGSAAPQPVLSQAPRRAALALLLLVPAPSIGVLCAMFLFPGTALGASIQVAAKLWILALPIVWVLLVERGRLRLPRWSWDGMTAGVVTGLATLVVIIGAWELFAHRMVDVSVFQEKMIAIGLDSPAKFLAFAATLTFINALLEEYVWRWFVYSKWFEVLKGPAKAAKTSGTTGLPGLLPGLLPGAGAVVLAGLCFMLHHTIAMSLYFNWQVNAMASLGVFTGGVIWSIIYLRYKNIYAGYVSHIFADIALFYVGYTIAFG